MLCRNTQEDSQTGSVALGNLPAGRPIVTSLTRTMTIRDWFLKIERSGGKPGTIIPVPLSFFVIKNLH